MADSFSGASDFEVIVIGGSLAGASAAFILGSLGRRVLVLERGHFPRRKACGEGLSALGIETLRRVGLSSALERVAGLPFRGYEIWNQGRRTEVEQHSEEAAGVGVERYRLDASIAEACRALPTVQYRFGAMAEVAELSAEGALVQVGEEYFRSHFLIVADGRDSPTARKLGIAEELRGAGRYGISLPFAGEFQTLPGRVTVILGESFQAFLTPISPTLMNVSALGSPNGVNLRSLVEGDSFQHLIEAVTTFRGEPAGSVLGKQSLQNGRRTPYFGRALLIGDAAEHLDPIGGMGMTHALLSAELAADSIEAVLAGECAASDALRRYALRRDRAARPLRGFTGVTHGAFATMRRHPRMMSFAMSRLGHQFSQAMWRPRGESVLGQSLTHFSLSLIGALL